MKNSPLSAFVMLGVAVLVGGLAFLFWGDPEEGEARTVKPSPAEKRAFSVHNLEPKAIRQKLDKEAAEGRLEEYRRKGEMTDFGMIKVKDEIGGHYFVKPKLLTGKGRYGETWYAIGKYARRPNVLPLQKMVTPPREHKAKRMGEGLFDRRAPPDVKAAKAARKAGQGGSSEGGTGQGGTGPVDPGGTLDTDG